MTLSTSQYNRQSNISAISAGSVYSTDSPIIKQNDEEDNYNHHGSEVEAGSESVRRGSEFSTSNIIIGPGLWFNKGK